MPAQTRRDLFLQIGGSADGLTAAAKAGRTALLNLQGTAEGVAGAVESALSDLGAGATDQSLKALEQSFNRTFNTIRANAERALSAPGASGATDILNLAGAQRAAEGAEKQAAQFRLLADASAEVARRAGDTGDKEKLLAVAFEAQAVEAANAAKALRAQASVLEQVAEEAGVASAANDNVAGSHTRMGASGMIAEHVMRSFTDSIAAGQSPVRALTMEMGRITEAMTLYAAESNATEGAVGKFAAFMGGQYGLAISVAVAALVPLIGHLAEGNETLDDAVNKLKADAHETDLARAAHEAFSRTIEGEIENQRKLNDELDRSIRTQRQNQQLTLYNARKSVSDQQTSRTGLVSKIADAEKRAASADAALLDAPGENKEGLAKVAGDAHRELDGLNAQLRSLDASIVAGARAVREAEQPLIASDVAAGLDKKTEATLRYEKALGLLNARLAIGPGRHATGQFYTKDGTFVSAGLTGIDENTYRTELAKIEAWKKQALADAKPERGGAAAASNLGDMVALIKQLFPGVRITSTNTGKHVGNSDHYADRAIDFVPAGGMGSLSFDDVRQRLLDAGVHIRRNAGGTEQFFGPGHGPGGAGDHSHDNHFHVAWSGDSSPESADRRADAAQRKREEQQRREQAAREKAARDQEEYGQSLARATEENLRLTREQVVDVQTAADLDARQVAVERQRLDDAAKLGKTTKGWSDAQVNALLLLNQQNAELKEQAIRRKEASQLLQQQFEAEAHSREARDALLQIDLDMAQTRRERLALEKKLLADRQAATRAGLEKTINDPTASPEAKQLAQADVARLPAQEAAQNRQLDHQYQDPMASYREELTRNVGDMHDALKNVQVDALKGLEDGLIGIVSGTESVASAFKKMASSIIADLARIAVEKLILSVIGLKDGGEVGGGLLHLATGGFVSGPGGPREDKVPAMLSNGEFVVNAAAYGRHGALVRAINEDRLPRFADGGVVGDLTGLSYPALPSVASLARPAQREVVYVQVDKSDLFDVHVQRAAAPLAQAAMIGGARQAQQDMADHSMARIPT